MSLPPASELPTLSSAQKSDAIALLFEPCPTLVELVLPLTTAPTSWPDLIERVRAVLLALPATDPRTTQIVAAHPRLGAKKVDSAQSQAEQASLESGPEVAAKLAELNAQYEETFPGLRYVVFVAGRPRPEIMQDMTARINEGDYAREVARAFNAMCDIALDRSRKLLSKI